MEQLVVRRSRLFVVDKTKLQTKKAQSNEVVNALYAAIYEEFKGASTNPKYKTMNNKELMDQVNSFSWNWLKERGLK